MIFDKIYLILVTINVVFSVDRRIPKSIGKCCPPGKVVSVVENFTCAFPYSEHSRELHDTRNNHWGYENSSGCLSTNATVKSLNDIVNKTISGSIKCIDLLYHDNFEYTPFIFYCNDNSGIDENKENPPVPHIATFRTCCAQQQIYNIDTRECITTNNSLTLYQGNIINNIHNILHDTVDFTIIIRDSLKCDNPIVDYVINITQDLRVLHNGTFQIFIPSANGSTDRKNILLTEDNSCVDMGSSHDLIVVRLCENMKFCETNRCIRKCCDENEGWIGDGCKKLNLQKNKTIQFHRELEKIIESNHYSIQQDVLKTKSYGLIIGKQTCPNGMYPVLKNESWHITSRGHIDVPNYKIYQHHEYCMEILYDTEYYTDGIYPCVCFEVEENNQMEVSSVRLGINAALELTSCAFLLVTFLVYICLPLAQNLHGKTFICHVASLFVAYACLATVALTPPPDAYTNQENIPDKRYLYKFLGYTMLFAFIACFSWLNVMSFDIWWTFGGLGGAVSTEGRKRAQLKRFLIYSTYAWGFALLVTSLAVTVDHTDAVARQLRPNIAIDSVWFQQESNYYGEIIYFIGPISIQLIINIILFSLTIRHCNRIKAEISRLMTPTTDINSRRFRSDRTKLILNIKLFIIMGISWILEIASYLLNHFATNFSWREEFFYVSDAFNCLQGFLIFILFVFKTKVYYALMHRLGRHQQTNMPTNLGTMSLQDPHRVKKSASCSTLMSTYGPVNTTPSSF